VHRVVELHSPILLPNTAARAVLNSADPDVADRQFRPRYGVYGGGIVAGLAATSFLPGLSFWVALFGVAAGSSPIASSAASQLAGAVLV
jgi:hypothetical protein